MTSTPTRDSQKAADRQREAEGQARIKANKTDEFGLESMTTVQLRSFAKEHGCTYSGNDRKADLIAKIRAYGSRNLTQPVVTLASEDPEFIEALADEEAVEQMINANLTEVPPSVTCDCCGEAVELINGKVTEVGTICDGQHVTKVTLDEDPADHPIGPVAHEDRIERVRLARAEFDQLKAWLRDPQGPRPATPNLDATNVRHETQAVIKSTSSRTRPATDAPMQFYKDSQPMAPSKNKLRDLAWHATKNISHITPERITTDALRALLTDAGITEPDSTKWALVLPNGVTIAGVPTT